MVLTFQIILVLLVLLSTVGIVAELSEKRKEEASYYLIVCVTSLASFTALILFS